MASKDTNNSPVANYTWLAAIGILIQSCFEVYIATTTVSKVANIVFATTLPWIVLGRCRPKSSWPYFPSLLVNALFLILYASFGLWFTYVTFFHNLESKEFWFNVYKTFDGMEVDETLTSKWFTLNANHHCYGLLKEVGQKAGFFLGWETAVWLCYKKAKKLSYDSNFF